MSGSKGKGKQENGELFCNSRTKESIKVTKVRTCHTCGEDLSDTGSDGSERRTKIDIVFEKVVEHVDAEIKTCPNCSTVSKGRFPSDMPGPLQYGIGIKAYVVNLLIAQMISLNRIQKMVKALIGKTLSETSILRYVMQLYVALEPWERRSIEQLLKTRSMHVDETSLRVDRKNYWVHV